MDWQVKIGLGVGVVFGLLPFAVKDMPAPLTWAGLSLGTLFILWGLLPNHDRLPLGPVLVFITAISALVASVAWYRETDTISSDNAPDVTLSLVFPESPSVYMKNISNKLAREIKWTVVLWNMSDPKVYSDPNGQGMGDKHEPLPIPTQTFDFIRPHSNSGPLNIFDGPRIKANIKKGDILFGSASVICPDCARGHSYIIYIEYENSGWLYEQKENKSGDAIIPTRLTKERVTEYYNLLINQIPLSARAPIKDLF